MIYRYWIEIAKERLLDCQDQRLFCCQILINNYCSCYWDLYLGLYLLQKVRLDR